MTPSQRLEVMGIAGRARLDQPEEQQPNEIADAADDMALGTVAWRSTIGPSVALTQRVAAVGQRFRNENPLAVEIGRGRFRDLSYRSERVLGAAPAMTIEAAARRSNLRASQDVARIHRHPQRRSSSRNARTTSTKRRA